MQPNGKAPTPHLSELLRAVETGLRETRQLLSALEADGDERIVGYPDVPVVLIDGLRTADALGSIAQRLEQEGD